ncbi:MAG: hypothetical protein BJ554DRAFT_2754, partial [Olpidium bornovanus]
TGVDGAGPFCTQTGPRAAGRARSRAEEGGKFVGHKPLKESQVRLRATDILLSNNHRLLSVICHSNLAGGFAVSASAAVLSVLLSQGRNFTEQFLQDLLREKMELACEIRVVTRFFSLERVRRVSPSDILRDNSVATMLVNAYAREAGGGYMRAVLQDPVRSVHGLVEKCEMDPAKVAILLGAAPPGCSAADAPADKRPPAPPLPSPNAASGTAAAVDGGGGAPQLAAVEEVLVRSAQNLRTACARILTAILASREEMPAALRRMALFVRRLVEDAEEAASAAVTAKADEPPPDAAQAAPPKEGEEPTATDHPADAAGADP